MSELMKKHRISGHSQGSTFYITDNQVNYAIPKQVANKYVVSAVKAKKQQLSMRTIFDKLEDKYTKAGVLLQGLRHRENLTQVAFAKKIAVTQANLSNMENGKRPIGKIIAKRIEQVFGTNYRYFLE